MLAEEDTQQRSNTWRSGLASSLTLKIENSLREKEKIFKDTVTENFCWKESKSEHTRDTELLGTRKKNNTPHTGSKPNKNEENRQFNGNKWRVQYSTHKTGKSAG